ncbi:YeaH/YhbH family protein [Azospirillum halopraeferens]|uniref:YeaH/YhbH family protein n=1 Tax=Azospirillum halopraeferens TaxID=34010 RepID=UPI000406A922|nr:YeaH/YhbH family protein [Azospirillum halopraeferens]
MNIIDRRLNPQGKSLANRQRFLRRAKEQVVKAVREASSKRGIQDIENGDKISISTGGVREPTLHRARSGGVRDYVVPGNHEYVEGDTIPRPEEGGGRGREGSPDGEGEDDFRFVLSREEFLDIFLEDLELPDLVKQKVKQSESFSLTRAGYSVSGSPSNLNLVRTMRNSLSRRIALRRPKPDELLELERELADAEARGDDPERLEEMRRHLDHVRLRSRRIPFIDPIDVRYNRFESVPKPIAQAVMFCLMDVSGSMTEHMKDLAKRFFMLLYLFLKKRYRSVDIVFIRHTHEAKEVDEETFFYSTETGGTVVSTALEEMQRVVRERYPENEWNIYAAQASDGDNMSSDNARSAALLRDGILPLCQYFAYIEVAAEHNMGLSALGRETELWRTYKLVQRPDLPLAMRRVRSRREIFPVFRELFARDKVGA